ncbi:MAG: hypothetical protein IJW06_02645 [Clostridia bacterium]|nr:hypothetical protein [Clostridia bacterium]
MKKTFSIIGILVGVALIIIGIATMGGGLGGNTSHGFTNALNHDNGYTSFGAAFYTYVNNNAAEISENTSQIAWNTDDIGDFLKNFFGIISICFGMITICGFGIVYSGCPKKEKTNVFPTEQL